MIAHLIRSAALCLLIASGWGYAVRIIVQDWRSGR